MSRLKHSKSHSSVRHSSYAPPSDNSEAAGEPVAVAAESQVFRSGGISSGREVKILHLIFNSTGSVDHVTLVTFCLN